ncbi:MAG: DNA gyrase inhibitor YacG [Pseudomonadales bacterium]
MSDIDPHSQPARIVRCPSCKTSIAWSTSNLYRPFCSERCRLIDFGDWADERHSIAGRPAADEMFSDDLPEQDS